MIQKTAVLTVLKDGAPRTSREVYNEIIKKKYYEFKGNHSVTIINNLCAKLSRNNQYPIERRKEPNDVFVYFNNPELITAIRNYSEFNNIIEKNISYKDIINNGGISYWYSNEIIDPANDFNGFISENSDNEEDAYNSGGEQPPPSMTDLNIVDEVITEIENIRDKPIQEISSVFYVNPIIILIGSLFIWNFIQTS